MEGVLLNKECGVCYKKFIDVKDNNYNLFLSKIIKKYKLTDGRFEGDTTCLCYDDRFECLVCKNIVCRGCLMHMPDYKNGKILDSLATYMNRNNEAVYRTLDMDDTGIITCPFCRKIDYRQFYTNNARGVLPEEILYDIKKRL
jgi:hypothetical protein